MTRKLHHNDHTTLLPIMECFQIVDHLPNIFHILPSVFSKTRTK